MDDAAKETNKSGAPQYITPARLKGEHGWLDAMIKQFLGEPDRLAPNPHYSSAGAPMRLYCLTRVLACEESAGWKAARAKAAKRSEASRRSAQAQGEKLVQTVADELVITVPRLADDELTREAIEHYNQRGPRNQRAEEYWIHASIHSEPQFLDRIKVNYLRHHYTLYDEELEGVRRQVGADKARTLIRDQVLAEIARIYPQLAAVCEGQRRDWKRPH